MAGGMRTVMASTELIKDMRMVWSPQGCAKRGRSYDQTSGVGLVGSRKACQLMMWRRYNGLGRENEKPESELSDMNTTTIRGGQSRFGKTTFVSCQRRARADELTRH